MSKRKCIYTGLDSETMDKFMPKTGGDENHNWSNSVPCSNEYKKIKGKRLPNDAEHLAYKEFMELERLRLLVSIQEGKLRLAQAIIRKKSKIFLPEEVEEMVVEKPKKRKKISKEKEIQIAIKEKEIQEINIDKILETKKMEW